MTFHIIGANEISPEPKSSPSSAPVQTKDKQAPKRKTPKPEQEPGNERV